MLISPADAEPLYQETQFDKCILSRITDEREQIHELLTTIGIHPELGHVVMVQSGCEITLLSWHMHDLEAPAPISPLVDPEAFDQREKYLRKILEAAKAKAVDLNVLEIREILLPS